MAASGDADRTAAFRQAAQALNEAGDKDLRKEVYAAFRRAAKPLGEKVIAEGSAGLPHRGGLSARVARSKMTQANATTGRNPGVSLRFKSVDGYALKAMDAGTVRHPVFARGTGVRTWVRQQIRSNLFTTPFEAGKENVAREVVRALEEVVDQIVKKSKGPGI